MVVVRLRGVLVRRDLILLMSGVAGAMSWLLRFYLVNRRFIVIRIDLCLCECFRSRGEAATRHQKNQRFPYRVHSSPIDDRWPPFLSQPECQTVGIDLERPQRRQIKNLAG